VRRRIRRSADDLISRMLIPPEVAALQFPRVSRSSGCWRRCLTLVMYRWKCRTRRRETGMSSAEVSIGDGRPGCR
jgi:hypothetical protein